MTVTPEMQALADEVWSGRPLPDGRYAQICEQLHALLSKQQLESLGQLVKFGPVWDGDVVSKATRAELFDLRMASRAMYREKEGYTVANYFGYRVLDPLYSNTDWRHEQTLLESDGTPGSLRTRREPRDGRNEARGEDVACVARANRAKRSTPMTRVYSRCVTCRRRFQQGGWCSPPPGNCDRCFSTRHGISLRNVKQGSARAAYDRRKHRALKATEGER